MARADSVSPAAVAFGADGTLATAADEPTNLVLRVITPDGHVTSQRVDKWSYLDDVRLIVAPDGSVDVLWSRGRRILVRTYAAAGGLGPERTVATLPPGLGLDEVQVGSASNGEVTVLWSACVSRAYCALMTATIRPDGSVGPPQEIEALGDGVAQPLLRVAPSGAAAVLWAAMAGDGFSIRGRLRAPNGTFGPERPVTHTYSALSLRDVVGPNRRPLLRFPETSAAIAPDGTVTVAWDRELRDVSNFLQARTISPTGQLGRVWRVGHGQEPIVAASGSNTAVVFVKEPPHPTYAGGRVMAWTRSADNPAGKTTLISKTSHATAVNAAATPSGNVVASWCCEDRGRLNVATLTPAGELGRPVTLDRNDSFDAVLAVSPTGRALTAWSAFDDRTREWVLRGSFGP